MFKHDTLLQRALAASLALHLMLALLIPNWMAEQSGELQPIETLSFARLVRLEIRRPPARAPAPASPKSRIAKPAAVPRAHVALSAPAKRRTAVSKAVVTGKAERPAAAQRAVAATVYAGAQAPAPAAAASRTVTTPATPPPETMTGERPVTGQNSDRGGVMPLGAQQDPVLSSRTLSELQQKVTVHVTLRVEVDEDGRTEHVTFDPPLDPQTERQIEAILADANWDAAVCGGGVSCRGTATIRL